MWPDLCLGFKMEYKDIEFFESECDYIHFIVYFALACTVLLPELYVRELHTHTCVHRTSNS